LCINATFVENKCSFLTFLLQQKLALILPSSGVASQKVSWSAKMFDCRRATVFLFGTPLIKAQND